MKTPRVYVGTYNKYNEGSIQGEWIDLEGHDADSFIEACKELHSDEDDPEFMYQDWEGIPDAWTDESSINPKIWEFIELDEDDRETWEAYMDNVGDSDWSDAQDAYVGEFDNDEDFAEDMAEQLGYMDRNVSWPFNCIDWERAARNLMYDYFESKGKYFRHC